MNELRDSRDRIANEILERRGESFFAYRYADAIEAANSILALSEFEGLRGKCPITFDEDGWIMFSCCYAQITLQELSSEAKFCPFCGKLIDDGKEG